MSVPVEVLCPHRPETRNFLILYSTRSGFCIYRYALTYAKYGGHKGLEKGQLQDSHLTLCLLPFDKPQLPSIFTVPLTLLTIVSSSKIPSKLLSDNTHAN